MPFFKINLGKKNTAKIVDSATKIVNGAVSGIDKAFFTDEERADYAKGIMEQAVEFVKLTLNENTARSITRRIIAVLFVAEYLIIRLTAAGLIIAGNEKGEKLRAMAAEENQIIMAVVIFYFGYYGTMKIMEWRKSRKPKK